jgi:Fe-S-cluster-containing hydrogenase component 2
MLCVKKCPTDAIIGAKKTAHFIVEEKCIGCGTCMEVCNFDAIEVF